MARVTVEDCVMRVPNRFELVLVAGQRARSIASGAAITLDRDNDKNPVVALREIAEATISIEGLRNALVTGLQKQPDVDEPEEETEFSMTEGVWPQAGVGGGEDELGEGMHYTDADGADLDAEIEVDEPGVEPAEDDL